MSTSKVSLLPKSYPFFPNSLQETNRSPELPLNSALFSAVECRQLERAKTILEERKVNVNR